MNFTGLFILCSVPVLLGFGIWYFSSPFHFPYFTYTFAVDEKRTIQMGDLLDNFIIEGNFGLVESHEELLQDWMQDCERHLSACLFAKHRRKQYEACLDLDMAYRFMLRQKLGGAYSYQTLKERFRRLQTVGFTCLVNK